MNIKLSSWPYILQPDYDNRLLTLPTTLLHNRKTNINTKRAPDIANNLATLDITET